MNGRRVALLALVTAFSLCLLILFRGVENEPYRAVQPARVLNMYGRPTLSVENSETSMLVPASKVKERLHAQDCPPLWRSYVESYLNNTRETEQLPPIEGINFSQTTSAKFTTIAILNTRPTYHLCDVLLVRIQSRDWNNQPKKYGGDYFRSKIYQQKPYSAASEDEIVDYQNGTYLALFTLRWTGEVKVQIKLIHPVELLPQMALTLTGKVGLNVTFAGEFKSGKVSEEVICRYVELPAPMCNLSNPRTHGPWFCQRPKNERLTCKDWRFHKMYKGTFMKLEENLSPLSKEMLTKSHMVEIKNNCKLKVQNTYVPNTEPSSISPKLPFCRMNGAPTGIHTSGHFFRDKWYPDNCTVVDYDQLSAMECLRNKTVVFLGDSTSRQIFTYFRDKYKKYFKTIPLPEGAFAKYGPMDIENLEYHTSVHFSFHGLPRSGTNLVLRTDFIEFIADRLNSGRDGCEVVYVMSLWAHFIATGKEFYVQRLLSIKHAIGDFLDQCPGSQVIFKGANTKDHPALWISVISSEWNIAKHELALRDLFHDEKRIGFIDAFDITKAQRHKDSVHPNIKIVREYVNMILTYLCKS